MISSIDELGGDVAPDAAEQLDVVVGLLDLLLLLLQRERLLLHGDERTGLGTAPIACSRSRDSRCRSEWSERFASCQVVEDEQALEPAAERHGHGQHRLGYRQVRRDGSSSGGRPPVRTMYTPLLHPLGAVRISVRDVVLGERDAVQLLGVIAQVCVANTNVVRLEVAHQERALLAPGARASCPPRAARAARCSSPSSRLMAFTISSRRRSSSAWARTSDSRSPDLLRAFGHDALEPAALGPELLRAKADQAEDCRRRERA